MLECGLRKARTAHGSKQTPPSQTRLGGVTPNVEQINFGSYILLNQSEIGRGTYGQVVLAKEILTERRVALKVFQEVDEAKQEIAMYQHLWAMGGHQYILPLLRHSANPPTPFMSMPFSTGVNLRKCLKDEAIDRGMRQGIVAQLAEAMTWLHTSKVVHLDMKPGNLLWEWRTCNLVVVDFGMSLKLTEDGTPRDDITPFSAVTASYRPPELWHTPVTKETNCYPVDVWSFGVTAIEILSRQMLFIGASKQKVYAQVESWMQLWRNKTGHEAIIAVPSHLRNVIWFCCAPEPALRPPMNGDIKDWALRLPPCPMKCASKIGH